MSHQKSKGLQLYLLNAILFANIVTAVPFLSSGDTEDKDSERYGHQPNNMLLPRSTTPLFTFSYELSTEFSQEYHSSLDSVVHPYESKGKPQKNIGNLLPSPSVTLDPEEAGVENPSWAFSRYQDLVIGKTVKYTLSPQLPVYRGPRMSMNAADSQLVLVYSRNSTERFSSGYGGGPKRLIRSILRPPRSVLVIRTCTHLNHHVPASTKVFRTGLYAFIRDPGSLIPGLLTASDFDPKLHEEKRCMERSRLEVPISEAARLYILISQARSLSVGSVSVSAAFVPLTSVSLQTIPWHVAALRGPKGTFRKEPSVAILKYVYLLSSVPYLQHYELRTANIDASGMAHLSPTLGNALTDPFCNPKGTELAAAILGEGLGAGPSNVTLAPVPIRSCMRSSSQETLLRALAWVSRHMAQTSPVVTFVIVEGFEDLPRLMASKAVGEALTILKQEGALTIVPAVSCHFKDDRYLSVGPYGIRSDGRAQVLNMNASCLQDYDIFAPGLRVLGASTIGPMAYRNVSVSAEIAAASVVGVMTHLIARLDGGLNLDDLKKILGTNISRTKAFVGNEKAAIRLPLLGSEGIVELNSSITALYMNSSQTSDNKLASTSIIPNLSNTALIALCACAGVIVVALVIGSLVYMKRQSDDESEFSYIIMNNPNADNPGEQSHEGNLAMQGSQVLTIPHGDVNEPSPTKITTSTPQSTSDRKTHQPEKRLPVVHKRLTLSRSRDSQSAPGTPNAKASWFATPKAPAPGVPSSPPFKQHVISFDADTSPNEGLPDRTDAMLNINVTEH